MIEAILNQIVGALCDCPSIAAVVLGGSRATGTATAHSDIDIGIYYRSGEMDFDALNEIAERLDDEHRKQLVCREGEWGNWVNCGGWLMVSGRPVDLILRDYGRVLTILDRTDAGKFGAFYQTGHPHAFIDVMYRGELASCKVLHAGNSDFWAVKRRAEIYPEALQNALLDFFLFEAGFSCMLAEKYMSGDDVYYLAGHLFRSVSALNQALFALNQAWCLNEKKAICRIDTFQKRPDQYSKRVNAIFESMGGSPSEAIQMLKTLCDEAKALRGRSVP